MSSLLKIFMCFMVALEILVIFPSRATFAKSKINFVIHDVYSPLHVFPTQNFHVFYGCLRNFSNFLFCMCVYICQMHIINLVVNTYTL